MKLRIKRGDLMISLTQGDKVGFIALSNGLDFRQEAILRELNQLLSSKGINVIYAKFIYRLETIYAASDQQRANQLMDFYKDEQIKAIFDVSGGDLANGVLSYLDYEIIARTKKPFFGYSDLTVVLNALYTQAKQPSYLYQIKNLVGHHAKTQQKNFFHHPQSLLDFNQEWIQGSKMEGITVGGNIRCFLKLAGTPYFPDFQDKILVLESLSGDVPKMATYLNQYKQIGVFDKINGLILGTFTEMEQNQYQPDIVSLTQRIIQNDQLPILKTNQIGHGSDSKAIMIGQHQVFRRES